MELQANGVSAHIKEMQQYFFKRLYIEMSLTSGLHVMSEMGKSSMDLKTEAQDYVLTLVTKQKISY